MTESELVERADSLTADSDPGELANLIGLIADAERRLRDLRHRVTETMIEAVRARGGSVTVGHIRYCVAPKKVIKPVSLLSATEAMLRAVKGDIARLAECLAADAFKLAHCRRVLGEDFTRVFTEEERFEVREGKACRAYELKKIDTRLGLIKQEGGDVEVRVHG